MGKELIEAVDRNHKNRAPYRVLIAAATSTRDTPNSWTLSFPCLANDAFFGDPVIQLGIPRRDLGSGNVLTLSVSDDRGRIAVSQLYVGGESTQPETDALQLILDVAAIGQPKLPDAVLAIALIAALHPQTPQVLGHQHPNYGITEEQLLSAIGQIAKGELLMASADHFVLDSVVGLRPPVLESLESRKVELLAR